MVIKAIDNGARHRKSDRRDLQPMIKAILPEPQYPVRKNLRLLGNLAETQALRENHRFPRFSNKSHIGQVDVGYLPRGNDLQRAGLRIRTRNLRVANTSYITESGMAYVPRGIRSRSLHSSLRGRKTLTWRRETGSSDTQNLRGMR